MRIQDNTGKEVTGNLEEDLTGATEEDSEEDPRTEDPSVDILEDLGEVEEIPGEDRVAVVDGGEMTEGEDLVTRIETKVIEISTIIQGGQVRMTEVSMTEVSMAITPLELLSS